MIRKSKGSTKKGRETKEAGPIVVLESRIRYFQGHIRGTSCCGLGEYSGCEEIRDVSDVIALRLGARRANKGLVFITTIPTQETARRMNALEDGGFRKMGNNRNPNTERQVTIWVAQTLQRRPNGYTS